VRLEGEMRLSEPAAPVEAQAASPSQVTALRSGDACPACKSGRMDYDGLLNLRCEQCGYSQGGGCFS